MSVYLASRPVRLLTAISLVALVTVLPSLYFPIPIKNERPMPFVVRQMLRDLSPVAESEGRHFTESDLVRSVGEGILSSAVVMWTDMGVPIMWDEHALKLSVDVPNSNSWVYNATLRAMDAWNTIQQYFVNRYYPNDTLPDRYVFYAANTSLADIQIIPLSTLSMPGMIAYTVNLGQNTFHIFVSSEVMTNAGMENEYYLTLLHELGHVFGIGDVYGENDVMDAVVSNATLSVSTSDLYAVRLLAISALAPYTFVYLPAALQYTQFTFS